MHDDEYLRDVDDVVQRIALLGNAVVPDPRHNAHLRAELMRRHRELAVAGTQHPAVTLGSRFAGLKILTLVAPPAFALGLVFSLFVWIMPMIGQPTTQSTEAAAVTRALARSVPNVTAVQFVLHQTTHGKTRAVPLEYLLKPRERLLVRYGHAYLWEKSGWHVVPESSESASSTVSWDLAFASLPARLTDRNVSRRSTFLPSRTVNGQRAIGWQFSSLRSGRTHVSWTLWINQHTGLVVQLQRVVTHYGVITERDVVDYQYERAK
ncbi:MAG: hypothetical protein ACR2GA_07360 [Chloroflexota bacterium]